MVTSHPATRLRLARTALAVLRFGLATVFIWFGVLKVSGDSPVADLLAETFPFIDRHLLVPALGAAEIGLGAAVMIVRRWPVVPVGLIAHLCGTFVTFALVPDRMFRHGNLLLLSADGEFVVKNLVLVGAALVLATVPAPR